MNISPILLLAIGSTFAFLYGLIITIGWAVTRRNRKTYQNEIGWSEVELIDLRNLKPLGVWIKTVSLENNYFFSENKTRIDLKKYDCYLVEYPSAEYPNVQKGDLILIDHSSHNIQYAFKVPDLKHFR